MAVGGIITHSLQVNPQSWEKTLPNEFYVKLHSSWDHSLWKGTVQAAGQCPPSFKIWI